MLFACSLRTFHRKMGTRTVGTTVQECRVQEIMGMDWKPVHSLNPDSFEDEAEFQILTQCLHELAGYEHDPSSPFCSGR